MTPFTEYLEHEIRRASQPPRAREAGECATVDGRLCPLCHARDLPYDAETRIRNAALQAFWPQAAAGIPLEPLVSSAPGRGYRSVTKRKVFAEPHGARIGLIETGPDGRSRPLPVQRCAIEPRTHAEVYRVVQAKLDKPYAKPLAASLRHVVVKGGMEEQTVIFTVDELSQPLTHAMNTLSKSLTHELPTVVSVFLYVDDASGSHYFGARDARKRPVFRRVFGKGEVRERACGLQFFFHPLSFSQVNPFVIDRFVTGIGDALELAKTQFLYDLYCGYGLFGLCLAARVKGVLGVEMSPLSVESATANAARMGMANARFQRSDLTPEAVHKAMARATPADVAIVDPPRNGAGEGVIEAIAMHDLARVAHLFCEIDLMPKEIARWKRHGYRPARAIPFDMFPGTNEAEIAVVFTKV
jgi:tRNA/tmRNA/rRNA uracil-C5-methylase (TrmA/RlmC/RlmD family)